MQRLRLLLAGIFLCSIVIGQVASAALTVQGFDPNRHERFGGNAFSTSKDRRNRNRDVAIVAGLQAKLMVRGDLSVATFFESVEPYGLGYWINDQVGTNRLARIHITFVS